jgi:hypothetical protein
MTVVIHSNFYTLNWALLFSRVKKVRKNQAGLPRLPAGTTKGKVLFDWFISKTGLFSIFLMS